MPDPTSSNLDCSSSTQVRVQIFRADGTHEPRYYTVDELARRWPPNRKTINKWLLALRRNGHAPQPGQIIRFGPPGQRRRVWVREDYAALVRAIYLEKTVKM